MTREDIGSYLGLTLETVSRTLSGFARCGFIRVAQKYIEIVDPDGLKMLRRLPALKR
jgi:CRP/FNR family transcriptional regulator